MSEQVTCHEWNEADVWGPGYWLVEADQTTQDEYTHYKLTSGYCTVCGDRLNADGTVTQMVPANIVAGCPICGDSVDVGDIEVSQDGTETVVYVSNCRRCEEQAAQDAYSRGMYVGRSGR